jgi:hypothetical protein
MVALGASGLLKHRHIIFAKPILTDFDRFSYTSKICIYGLLWAFQGMSGYSYDAARLNICIIDALCPYFV